MENLSQQNQYQLLKGWLNERQWRLYVATEARKIGAGGISQVAREAGVIRKTIRKGIQELEAGGSVLSARGAGTQARRRTQERHRKGQDAGNRFGGDAGAEGRSAEFGQMDEQVGEQAEESAELLLEGLHQLLTRVSHLFADKGYRGPLRDWIREQLGWETEIVPQDTNTPQHEWELINGEPVQMKKPKGGFQVQRKRWVVERTFGWLIRYRRLARDYEGLPSSCEAFIKVAAIRLFLTRLAPFSY